MDDYLANGQLLLFLGMCDPHHIIRTGDSIKVVKKKKKRNAAGGVLTNSPPLTPS